MEVIVREYDYNIVMGKDGLVSTFINESYCEAPFKRAFRYHSFLAVEKEDGTVLLLLSPIILNIMVEKSVGEIAVFPVGDGGILNEDDAMIVSFAAPR